MNAAPAAGPAFRAGFAGTPEFAAVALRAMLAAGFDVPLVLTQPDRPSGRGQRVQRPPVAQVADAAGITVAQPATLRDAASREPLQAARLDVLVVAAYGLILPPEALAAPRLGCLNIHASLLPRWRGAAPIHRAIEAGDARTGVCIMQMERGLDTGPVGLTVDTAILPSDTTATLHDRLAALGAAAIVDVLTRLRNDGAAAIAWQTQPGDGVTYAAKIDRAEAWTDWSALPARALHAKIRALDPSPGCCARLQRMAPDGDAGPGPAAGADGSNGPVTLRFFDPEIVDATAQAGQRHPPPPGTILRAGPAGVDVQCVDGVLRLRQWQRPGGRRLPAAAFLAGFALHPGDRLCLPDEPAPVSGNAAAASPAPVTTSAANGPAPATPPATVPAPAPATGPSAATGPDPSTSAAPRPDSHAG